MTDLVALRGPGDAEAVMRIWREASRRAHPFLTEADLDAQEGLSRREFLPRAEIVVAVRSGAVVGFRAMFGDRIGALFVDPKLQRSGVGRRLVEDAQARWERLLLNVYEDNQPARAFYERVGFFQVGRDECDDEGRPLPVLRLAWRRKESDRSPLRTGA